MKKIILIFIIPVLLFSSCENLMIGPDVKNTPEENFETLWKDIDKYYVLFDVKKVDWNAVYRINRPRINNNIPDNELWTILTDILKPLNDPHVVLMNHEGTEIFSPGIGRGKLYRDYFPGVILHFYLNGNYQYAGENNMLFSTIPGHSIGYIAIYTFSGNNINWSKDIDAIVESFKDLDGVIIDIRDNTGGYTENYQYIASAFIDRSITYLKWKARNGTGHNEFEPFSSLSIEPRQGKYQFTKKIAILTNSSSGSSSDHFNWIFKNYVPYAKQIGDTTTGNFGAIFHPRSLPNGWFYTYSARLTASMEGVTLDSLNGIPPDIPILNKRDDLHKGIDSVMEKAIEYIESKNI
jgi:carboxyl-terminal processing protease